MRHKRIKKSKGKKSNTNFIIGCWMTYIENINTSWFIVVYVTWSSIIHCKVIKGCCSPINISSLNLNGKMIVKFRRNIK